MENLDYYDMSAKKKSGLSLKITDELSKKLKRFAKSKKVSNACVVRAALESYLNEREKEDIEDV